MSVLPFTARTAPLSRDRVGPSAAPELVGSFRSPRGGHGSFRGTYRLERLVEQYGHPAAAGVFTGELTDSTGDRVGMASRRHTAAVQYVDGADGPLMCLGPVDVNLLGFLVTVDAFTVLLSRGLPAVASSAVKAPGTAAELLGRVVQPWSARGTASRAGAERADG